MENKEENKYELMLKQLEHYKDKSAIDREFYKEISEVVRKYATLLESNFKTIEENKTLLEKNKVLEKRLNLISRLKEDHL